MATYKAVLSPYKKTDGTHLILIRVTKRRKISYISVEHSVKPKYWNDGKVRATHSMHAIYNNDIKKIIRDAEIIESKAFHSDVEIDSKTIRKKVKKTPGKISFKALATDYINSLRVSSRTKKRYHSHLAMFTKIAGDITPEGITKTVILDFETKALEKKSENTIHRGIATLSGAYTALQISEDIPLGPNPFKNATVKEKKSDKQRLDIEEIEALSIVKGTSPEEISKDVFLLQYYLGGLRISDVLLLKIKNIHKNRILYSDMKTERPQSHIITPKAKEIIAKYSKGKNPDNYLLPMLTIEITSLQLLEEEIEAKTAYVNKYLKQLAKKANITKTITSHVARHSFADHLRKSGTNLYTISKALGHSSLEMTENYLESFDTDAVDNAMNDLFKTV